MQNTTGKVLWTWHFYHYKTLTSKSLRTMSETQIIYLCLFFTFVPNNLLLVKGKYDALSTQSGKANILNA